MTATIYMQVRDRGVLLMDGAAIDRDGRVVSIEPKGLHIPEWGGFIAGSGSTATAEAIRQIVIPSYASIDDLAEHGEIGFRTARDVMIEKYPGEFTAPWHVIVAAWSEADQRTRAIYFGSSADVYFEADIGHWVQPFPDDVAWAAFKGSLAASGGPASFDPVIHALPLIESQRRRPLGESDDGFATGQHFVGGFVQVSEIGRDGVSQRIIHTWPEDQVGTLIVPDPASAPRVRRQQRRALARQAA